MQPFCEGGELEQVDYASPASRSHPGPVDNTASVLQEEQRQRLIKEIGLRAVWPDQLSPTGPKPTTKGKQSSSSMPRGGGVHEKQTATPSPGPSSSLEAALARSARAGVAPRGQLR